MIRGDLTAENRHEVHHLADTVRGEEAGDQGGGVGKVHLLRLIRSASRTHPEVAATGVVQQRPNTLSESNRGQQNQSTDPSVLTSAAVWRSPIIP